MQRFSLQSEIAKAQRALAAMRDAGFAPTAAAYTPLLAACVRAPAQHATGHALFYAMLADRVGLNAPCVAAAIACAPSLAAAEAAFAALAAHGVPDTVQVYRALFDACRRHAAPEATALQWMCRFRASACHPPEGDDRVLAAFQLCVSEATYRDFVA